MHFIILFFKCKRTFSFMSSACEPRDAHYAIINEMKELVQHQRCLQLIKFTIKCKVQLQFFCLTLWVISFSHIPSTSDSLDLNPRRFVKLRVRPEDSNTGVIK